VQIQYQGVVCHVFLSKNWQKRLLAGIIGCGLGFLEGLPGYCDRWRKETLDANHFRRPVFYHLNHRFSPARQSRLARISPVNRWASLAALFPLKNPLFPFIGICGDLPQFLRH